MLSTGWARILIVVGVGVLSGVCACHYLSKRHAQNHPPAPIPATVESLNGEVLHVVMEAGVGVGSDQPATAGMPVREGSQFKVAPEGRVRIRTKVGSLLEIAPMGFTRGFALIRRLVPGGDYLGVELREGRASLAAVPDQSWEINRASGKGGLVSGLHGGTFRLVVKDGTASVDESDFTTQSKTTVPAGQQYTSPGEKGKHGALEPAPPDPLGDLNLLLKAQEKAQR